MFKTCTHAEEMTAAEHGEQPTRNNRYKKDSRGKCSLTTVTKLRSLQRVYNETKNLKYIQDKLLGGFWEIEKGIDKERDRGE